MPAAAATAPAGRGRRSPAHSACFWRRSFPGNVTVAVQQHQGFTNSFCLGVYAFSSSRALFMYNHIYGRASPHTDKCINCQPLQLQTRYKPTLLFLFIRTGQWTWPLPHQLPRNERGEPVCAPGPPAPAWASVCARHSSQGLP